MPEDLEEIVWRAMRKKPADRFSSGLEFAAARSALAELRGAIGGERAA